jgi:hypothetical protein
MVSPPLMPPNDSACWLPSRPAVGVEGDDEPQYRAVQVVGEKVKKESWDPPGLCASPEKLNITFPPTGGNAGPAKMVVVVGPGLVVVVVGASVDVVGSVVVVVDVVGSSVVVVVDDVVVVVGSSVVDVVGAPVVLVGAGVVVVVVVGFGPAQVPSSAQASDVL